jgi:hypothetical protein
MKARTKTLAIGGLLTFAGGGALLLRRRKVVHGAGQVRHVATVVTPLDEVRAMWVEAGRLPGLPARVAPAEGATAPAQQVPGVEGLRLRVVLSPAPAGRGTEIRVVAEGPAARSMSGRLREDVRRIKSVLEAGEAVTVEGQPSGRSPRQRRTMQKISRMLRRGGLG